MNEVQVCRHTITKDSDMIAPTWLAKRINYKTIKFLYRIIDVAEQLKGMRINEEVARIGDVIVLDGNRITIERKDA